MEELEVSEVQVDKRFRLGSEWRRCVEYCERKMKGLLQTDLDLK